MIEAWIKLPGIQAALSTQQSEKYPSGQNGKGLAKIYVIGFRTNLDLRIPTTQTPGEH